MFATAPSLDENNSHFHGSTYVHRTVPTEATQRQRHQSYPHGSTHVVATGLSQADLTTTSYCDDLLATVTLKLLHSGCKCSACKEIRSSAGMFLSVSTGSPYVSKCKILFTSGNDRSSSLSKTEFVPALANKRLSYTVPEI